MREGSPTSTRPRDLVGVSALILLKHQQGRRKGAEYEIMRPRVTRCRPEWDLTYSSHLNFYRYVIPTGLELRTLLLPNSELNNSP